MFKTFTELAGAKVPEDIQEIDGRSLVPLLAEPDAAWADRELFTHRGRWAVGADPSGDKHKNCAVRSKRWRLVNHAELYDIANDPYEAKDVAADHPKVVERLREAYDQWWEETLPLMVNETVPFAPAQPQTVRYEKQLKEKGIPDWEPPITF